VGRDYIHYAEIKIPLETLQEQMRCPDPGMTGEDAMEGDLPVPLLFKSRTDVKTDITNLNLFQLSGHILLQNGNCLIGRFSHVRMLFQNFGNYRRHRISGHVLPQDRFQMI